MNSKTFFLVSGVIYTAVAVLHGLRIVYRWEAIIGGWAMPMSISVIGLVVAGYLAYSAFSLSRAA
jgi:hypothetical protein